MSTEIASRGGDRRLYTFGAIALAVIAVGGFARTYYLKGVFGTPALDMLVHGHAVLMTTWIGFFIVQTRLVAMGRTHWHRRLGVFGALLATAVVVVGTLTAIDSARRGLSPGGIPPLVFLVVPLGALFVFGVLLATALWFRKRSDIHKRLMLLASLSILTPAIARFFMANFQIVSPPLFLVLTDVLVISCVAWDTAKHRRLHPAFGWGFLFFIASQPLRFLLGKSEPWMQFATWLIAS